MPGRHRGPRLGASLGASLAALLAGAAASADPLDLYGLGSRATAMAGAQVAVADDAAAVHYNPAGLPQVRRLDAGLSVTFVSGHFGQLRDVVADAEQGDRGTLAPRMRDDGGGALALAVSLAERVALGLGVYLPSAEHLAVLATQRQAEPHVVLYDRRQERIMMLLGVGARVFGGLHLGVGVNVLFGPLGRMRLQLPISQQGGADLQLEFRPRVAPTFGALYRLSPRWRLAATYREPSAQGELDLNVEASLGIAAVQATIESLVFYAPRQLELGGCFRPTDRLLLALALGWQQWSAYADAAARVQTTLAGAPLPFRDTARVRLGAELEAARWALPFARDLALSARAGYGYRTSPVPSQGGPGNMIDSDAHTFGAGLGLALREPWGIGHTLTLDAHLQLQHLPTRACVKGQAMADLDGDGSAEAHVLGYPGYQAGGQVLSAGFSAGTRF